MPRIAAIEVVADRTATSRCDEGFLRLKRLTAVNRRVDGSASRQYPIDLIDRPALDAVAVVIWARTTRGIEVLTRAGLRPAAYFRRGKTSALPEGEHLLVEEIVAGVMEVGEVGLSAIRHRAADEVLEEAGFKVDPETIAVLGAPVLMLPGIVSEKIHLVAVELDRRQSPDAFEQPGEGDGSPLEEGAQLRWRTLPEALAACSTGEIQDAKTELGFRRLADTIAH